MVFSSLEFIFIFLPIFLIIYFCTPKKYRNYILLIGSIIFYIVGCWKKPHYLILLVLSLIINFIIGRMIEKNILLENENKKTIEKSKSKSKKILIIGIIYNVSWLILFKYSDFLISMITKITNVQINKLNLALPIGISFYTFELISYLVDVYKERCSAEKSILQFAMYIFMFPQLISGPIVAYPTIKKQLKHRTYNFQNIILGAKYFILGLAFKVLLANRIGCLWNDILMIGIESISTKLAWIGIIGFSLQIYFDFCGYSFMVVGLGKVIGFNLPENFETPYLATSMTEFFRKWHISLGNWFKNYLYIPLGGNRKGTARTILNLVIVWLATGLWHGASYNFVLWGLFVCLFIIIEKLFLGKFIEKHSVFGHLYMLVLIPIMWSIFAITDISKLQIFFSKLFGFDKGIYSLDYIKYVKTYGMLLILGIICCTKLPKKLLLRKSTNTVQSIILLVLFWTSIYYLYKGLNNPFLYFSF